MSVVAAGVMCYLTMDKNYVVECCGKQKAKFLYDLRSCSNAYCFACERSGSAKLEIQSIELDLKVVSFLNFYTDLNLVFVESFVHFIWSNIGQKSPFLFQDLMEVTDWLKPCLLNQNFSHNLLAKWHNDLYK